MKIVGVGGGTGLPVLLSGLKKLNDRGEQDIDITAIVAVSDSGGSTGRLREILGCPAMGDIRNCLVALSDDQSPLVSVYRHRFQNARELSGHSAGNLILAALYQIHGDFGEVVRQASMMLRPRGRVLPVTDKPVTLCGQYSNGCRMRGEANLPNTDSRLTQVWLEPSDAQPFPGVLEAIDDANVIVFGPGSLYTSIIPNVLVPSVACAIKASRAVKVYVCNLMTQPGETCGYTAAEHLQTLQSYLPPRTIDVCVYNTRRVIGTEVADLYSRSGAGLVIGCEDELREIGVVPAGLSLLDKGTLKVRHDPLILARFVVSTVQDLVGGEEMICSQWNGR